ncbi:MAG TPA: hypothetical protein LFW10_00360 [Rickettsia endosymbiont of Diachasma alloeum]|nr:hypothetical protein [Rickettsia endosymbiont of Diachasma alloeum]
MREHRRILQNSLVSSLLITL